MATVLVVDDSRIMRNTVKNLFSKVNIPCNYLEAANGKEALELIRGRPVDLVLLDWNMPELSGIDLLREVRAVEAFKKLPIFMITSEAAKYSVIEALKAGATDYIVKPVNLEVLQAKVTKHLAPKRTGKQP